MPIVEIGKKLDLITCNGNTAAIRAFISCGFHLQLGQVWDVEMKMNVHSDAQLSGFPSSLSKVLSSDRGLGLKPRTGTADRDPTRTWQITDSPHFVL